MQTSLFDVELQNCSICTCTAVLVLRRIRPDDCAWTVGDGYLQVVLAKALISAFAIAWHVAMSVC